MYYVFAAEYSNVDVAGHKQETRTGFHFGFVFPSGELPYIYPNEREARQYFGLVRHHAHLYSVSDDFATAELVECGDCTTDSPSVIVLDDYNQDLLQRAADGMS
jgi:hypothetical protein